MSHPDTSNHSSQPPKKTQKTTILASQVRDVSYPEGHPQYTPNKVQALSNDKDRQNAEVKASRARHMETVNLDEHEARLFRATALAALKERAKSADRRLLWTMIRDLRARGKGSSDNGELQDALEAIEKDPEAMDRLAESVERRKLAQSRHSKDVSDDSSTAGA